MIAGLLIVAAVAGVAVLAVIGNTQATSASESANDNSNQQPVNSIDSAAPLAADEEGSSTVTNIQDTPGWEDNITTDPATWPSGDRVWNICRAIAIAEGYNAANSNPFRLHNPGDLSDGASYFGYEDHSGSRVTKFPDAATGWNWLYDKISNHISGKSSTYPVGMTVSQFAQKYAANWQNWQRNVGFQLGIDPTKSTFASYVRG